MFHPFYLYCPFCNVEVVLVKVFFSSDGKIMLKVICPQCQKHGHKAMTWEEAIQNCIGNEAITRYSQTVSKLKQ